MTSHGGPAGVRYGLIRRPPGFRRAAGRWATLVNTPEFLADADLARALAMLSPEKFDKLIAYVHSPAGQRVRTNNHVERTNRRLRWVRELLSGKPLKRDKREVVGGCPDHACSPVLLTSGKHPSLSGRTATNRDQFVHAGYGE